MTDPLAGNAAPAHARKRNLILFAVAAAAGAVTVFLVFLQLRDTTPLLTREALEAAQARWAKHGLADYDIAVTSQLDARPAERYETQVRDGKAVRLSLNGAEVAPRDSYAIPALLAVAHRELEMAGLATPLPGQPRKAVLKAIFHETTGAPLVLKRIATGRQSYILTVEEIKVEKTADKADPGREVIWQRAR